MLTVILDRAEALTPLETVIVAHRGAIVAERGYHGHSTAAPANIMSASKSIISALVGIAIDRKLLEGPDQRIAPLLASNMPPNPDPRLREITIGHLLSMQAGLGSTSGARYGSWVSSRNWVRAALAQPFEDEPGGRMIYSTGSTHLLSAILTRQSGRSTLQLARDWLGPLDGFAIASWERDPEGIYLGGNSMAMSSRSLLAFGELYRADGLTPDGRRLISADWDRSIMDATDIPALHRRWLRLWLVLAADRRRGGQIQLGLWRADAVCRAASRTHRGHDIQRACVVQQAAGHRDDLHALLGVIIAAVSGYADGDEDVGILKLTDHLKETRCRNSRNVSR